PRKQRPFAGRRAAPAAGAASFRAQRTGVRLRMSGALVNGRQQKASAEAAKRSTLAIHIRVPGSRGVPVRDSPARPPGTSSADRAAPHAAGGSPPVLRAPLLRELPLPGAELEPAASGGGEGRVASRRAVPARRLPRHEPASLSRRVVAFYNGRGTAEQWIKEGKHAIKWTRLSCTTFRANSVRLQLHALAYNLATFLRTLALPGEIERWSLTTLREKVVKIGAKVIAHGRYLVFQMAEVAVPRALFRGILDRIAGLRPPVVARC